MPVSSKKKINDDKCIKYYYNRNMNRLVVAFVIFVSLNAMTFIVSDNNPICLEVEGGAEYHIEYIVSGPN